MRRSNSKRSWSWLLLTVVGCGFHFDEFHAAVASTSDAASPATTHDAAVPGASSRDAAPAFVDAGSGLGPEPTGSRDAADAGSDSLDSCAADGATSCVCDASACTASTPSSGPVGAQPARDMPVASPSGPGTAPPPPGPAPVPGLRLRYAFGGHGTTLDDRAGSAHGSLLGGAQLDGTGALTLDGKDDYATVPSSVLSALQSVTLVAWISSSASSCWQRVFDFGTTLDTPGELTTDTLLAGELFLTTDQCPARRVVAITRTAAGRQEAQSPAELARNRVVQLAVVLDSARQVLTLYIDGARANETGSTLPLRVLNTGTFWLGRSFWKNDPHAQLRFEEFRLYDRALTASDVAELARRGVDVL